ncbi:MAG TPA: serine/threonine-protein kinase [Solirubrobacteraceae bacterium]|nr:serine/threonine-protein kinase [Solirubrobacteraceae bacterium]
MLGRGDRIAGYEVEAVIARGGMGVVYRAHQVGLGRSVALKVIAGDRADDPTFRARFVREARLAASLDHPNVIPVFEAGDDGGELFIAMRLVDGSDLERLIDRSGPIDPGLACRIVAQAAAGLEAAHRLGLVHRDVKPANILLAGPVADPHVYVSDFGVAKSSTPAAALTEASEWVGTPGYAAPEQVRGGEVDARADVYALGCVLLAALTRRSPQPRPGLPAAVEAIVDRATAAAPSARFQSAGELADALRGAERTLREPAALGEPAGVTTPVGLGDPATTTTGAAAAVAALRPRPVATLPAATRRSAPAPRRRRARRALELVGGPRARAASFAVGFTVIVAGVLAVVLTRPGGHAAARHVAATTPRPAPAPSTPGASGDGDTVFCGASSCAQSGRRVLVPIEGGSCDRAGAAGTWTRLDAGAPEPMLICLPASNLPRVAAALSVPALTGGRLDHAEMALDRLGIPYRTSGGGLFGIVTTSNWTVCATSPPAGGELAAGAQVTVFVEHSC